MQGTKIIYIKEPTRGQDLGTMIPVVVMEGERMGCFSKVSVVSGSDNLQRPVLHLERIFYGPDDEILTMTEEEFEKWSKENLK
jgi:hypothetical protein